MGYYAAGGYYQAGGFFKKLFRGAAKLGSFVTRNPIAQAVVGVMPFGSTAVAALNLAKDIGPGGGSGAAPAAAVASSLPGHPVTLATRGRRFRLRRSRRRRR